MGSVGEMEVLRHGLRSGSVSVLVVIVSIVVLGKVESCWM